LGDEIIVMRDGKMISRGIISDFEKNRALAGLPDL